MLFFDLVAHALIAKGADKMFLFVATLLLVTVIQMVASPQESNNIGPLVATVLCYNPAPSPGYQCSCCLKQIELISQVVIDLQAIQLHDTLISTVFHYKPAPSAYQCLSF